MKIVCANCGEDDGFYVNVEVTGVGWENITIGVEDDKPVLADREGSVQEIDWDISEGLDQEFGCPNCGTQKFQLEQLVTLSRDDEDPPEVHPQQEKLL